MKAGDIPPENCSEVPEVYGQETSPTRGSRLQKRFGQVETCPASHRLCQSAVTV